MFAVNSEMDITLPSWARVPTVDQAMELAKMMELTNTPAEIARLLSSAAVTWEMATTFVIKTDNP